MALKQKKLHILTEAAGIIVGLALINFSTQVQDPNIAHWLFVFGVGNLIVDGYFITTWKKNG